jgi:colanic acid/amylovoran biosynthesis glycosyltransferase
MATEPPKIGYVLKVFPRLSQTFIVNEIRAHEQAGFEVVIFSLKRPRESDVNIVDPPLRSPVVYLAGPEASWARQLTLEIARLGIGHLHAHFGNVATTVAQAAAMASGIPYSFTAHAVDIFDDRVNHKDLQSKLEGAASVVTVSDYNVRHLRKFHDRNARRIYNGLPLDLFEHCAARRDVGSLLAVGRLIEKKGFSTLIDACLQLANWNIPFGCSIIGEGPLRPELERRILDHGLAGRVELLGARSPAEVRERLRRAAVLVAPCQVASSGDRDGLPTVLLEAMALGTPCVSTDVTGIPEIVIDGRTGIAVPPCDPERLATACRAILADPAMARRMARTARRRIETHFDCRETSARLREQWCPARRRVVFRIHKRRGLGHRMRAINIASELLELYPDIDVIFYARTPTALPMDHGRIRQVIAKDPEKMDLQELRELGLEPDVLIDDTILPPGSVGPEIKHVLVMRKRRRSKLEDLIGDARLRDIDLVIAPHTAEEFDGQLPEWLVRKTVFVGPIARHAKPSRVGALRKKYGLDSTDRLLVSTPGGGGFPADFEKLWKVACGVQRLLGPLGYRHVFVSGPNARNSVDPPDDKMIVIDVEPEMPTLLSMATAVISAGGYNTVNEIRLAKRPAFFLPGDRKYDDQSERVTELANAGFAWSFEDDIADDISLTIAHRVQDSSAMNAALASYQKDAFRTGNQSAAKAIFRCAMS